MKFLYALINTEDRVFMCNTSLTTFQTIEAFWKVIMQHDVTG